MIPFIAMFFATLIGGWFFPWWWPALIGYAMGFWLPKRSRSAFVSGFIGTGLAWATLAAFTDWQNHHLLSGRIATLFHLPSYLAVIAVTALVGAVTGGLGAWAGFSLGAYIRPTFRSRS